MISKKKFGTTVTAFGVAAGMLLSSAAPAHAEETAKTVQETQKEQADAPSTQSETENENAEKTIALAEETEKPGEETAASSDETAASTEDPETPDPAEDPTPSETPEDPTPSETPEPTPSETPTPTPSETPEPSVTPEPSETPTPTPSETPAPTETPVPTETPTPTPTETPKSDETQADDWIQTIDYGKYISAMKKDLRAGFAQIDKTYAYAKVDTKLNVRESGSTSARIVGTLPAKALCFVIADADQEWVYIESGDVRGFVRTDYLQQGKESLEYVTSTGEDQMKLADQIIDPSENEAFNYKKETVYEVKTSTGNGIITFAKQFVGRPYVWGGNSLTDGIDCSHFVWQILTRCGAYDGEYTTSDGWRSLGTEVTSLDEARTGDVICYNGHVALYDGEGKIVEALNENAGITCNRPVDCDTILTIRRFAADDEIGGTNAEKIWNYFLMHGFTKEGAAGIMGNIANEASTDLNPTLIEYGSTSRTSLSGEQYTNQFVGRPYVWGGNSLTDGIDCSHFVWQILTRCGAYDGEYTTSDGWRSLGTEVTSLDEARTGDVICYNGHVALYDGEGKIVEALNENAGITCNRPVDCDTILTIRRFAADDEIGGTNAEKIWNYFLMHGFTKEGAAGIMGNIANEASTDLNPTLIEYGSTSRTSLSGEQYTNLVDAGIISRDEVIRSARFGLYSGGRYGYGLCGFTDPTIKEYLCRYTIDLGKSLGSLSGQLDSLLAYLNDYNPNLLDRLKNAEDVDTAATSFMREYEKCANQGTQQKLRTTAAEQIYNVMESYDSPVDVE